MAKLESLVQKQLGDINTNVRSARGWFRGKIAQLKGVSPKQLMKNTKQHEAMASIGSMYAFYYDPKYKEQLPYYDRFPLVLPIEKYGNGFLGINLHYLPPRYRLILMDKLIELANDKKLTDDTRLKLSYGLLRGATKYKEVKPCLKKYLYAHVETKFLYIKPTEWEKVIFMPVERFVKSSKQKVWSESTGGL